MNNKLIRTGVAVAFAAVSALGLAACGGDASTPETSASSSEAGESTDQGDAQESEAFVADLTEGVKIINDQLQEIGTATQIMLASDVEQPTQKYGMWVMPYYPSDAVEKYISTIQIDDGKFVVTATSAETGKQWEMDQDGNLSEASAE